MCSPLFYQHLCVVSDPRHLHPPYVQVGRSPRFPTHCRATWLSVMVNVAATAVTATAWLRLCFLTRLFFSSSCISYVAECFPSVPTNYPNNSCAVTILVLKKPTVSWVSLTKPRISCRISAWLRWMIQWSHHSESAKDFQPMPATRWDALTRCGPALSHQPVGSILLNKMNLGWLGC